MYKRVIFFIAGTIAATQLILAQIQVRDAKQAIDEDYTSKIREYTTEPFFNSPWTDYLPASQTVPTPKAVLGDIAGATAGFVGADLRNIVNEAALIAARKGEEMVTRADFDEAIERSVLGLRRPIVLGQDERRLIAYHESGHALMGLLIAGADPVKKLTIVPRGLSLGSTYSQPIDDRYNYPEAYLRGRISLALGGRAAEEVAYGAVTTGAESDLQQVNQVARSMVARFGMSPKIGPINLTQPGDGAASEHFSEETARLLDEEVRRIVEECHREAVRLLTENRDRLDRLAAAVLKKDTLDQDEIYDASPACQRLLQEGRRPGARRGRLGNPALARTLPR